MDASGDVICVKLPASSVVNLASLTVAAIHVRGYLFSALLRLVFLAQDYSLCGWVGLA